MRLRALLFALLAGLSTSACTGLVAAVGLMPKEAGGGYQTSGSGVSFWPELGNFGMDSASKAFQHYSLSGADAQTFVTLSRSPWYGKDKAHVYYESELIIGANPATFKLLSEEGYAADGVSVFYKGRKLEGAEAASIDFSGSPFVVDRTGVYFHSERLPGAVAPMTRLEPYGYARDAAGAVFHFQMLAENGVPTELYAKVDLCDPSTFTIFGGRFGLDSKCVYFESKRLPLADPASFKLLGASWAKDRNAVFQFEVLAPGADPSTAEVVFSADTEHRNPSNAYFMRDKFGCRSKPTDRPQRCPSDVVTLEALRQSRN